MTRRDGTEGTSATTFVWSDDLTRYDFGPGHPMAPLRLSLTRDLVRSLELPGVVELAVADVDDDVLTDVHTPALVAAVRAAARGEASEAFGLGTEENPVFPDIHDSALRIVGSTLTAARAVWTPPAPHAVPHAVSIAGGMHHAMPDRASGFCVYNDVAIAIRWLLANGARRVAYVDLDAHHGDGVERVFWNDPRVLTISVHESGSSLFPGTGFASDVGGPDAIGSAVNLPLPARTRGPAWLRAVEAVVPPLVAEFAPDVLVTQHGADSHGNDQLTNLRVSVDHQLAAARLMRDLARQHAGDRWLATGGGGYTVVEVVPRVWAGLTAISAGGDVAPDGALPTSWTRRVQEGLRLPAPETWGDGEPGNPATSCRSSTASTRATPSTARSWRRGTPRSRPTGSTPRTEGAGCGPAVTGARPGIAPRRARLSGIQRPWRDDRGPGRAGRRLAAGLQTTFVRSPWVPSSRSAASGWPRRSTASCCARRVTSAATRSDRRGVSRSAAKAATPRGGGLRRPCRPLRESFADPFARALRTLAERIADPRREDCGNPLGEGPQSSRRQSRKVSICAPSSMRRSASCS
ncbi:hypothetical protein GCM10025875_24080 [Litorihabitans aurantiacus]|uniref:Acetoin utilization protein AcuC n=1 Tax=Litorihabitans aurantiacus TaxID=1930061 RepID=A0AA37XFS9_9MICO|nr:hypothetical protein GCM10025875_24080 [Litorihabitans aurantiacus]